MILSDRDIKQSLKDNKIKISPPPDLATQLGSCTLDLRLGNSFRVFIHNRTPFLDPLKPETFDDVTQEVTIPDGEFFTMHPGQFVLGMTKEYVEMPDDLTGHLEGRSSMGRLGIVIHSTAANIECGFRGNITLELANMGGFPVLLHPGMRICALSFSQLTSPAEVPYYKKKSAKYVGQTAPLASRIGEEKK